MRKRFSRSVPNGVSGGGGGWGGRGCGGEDEVVGCSRIGVGFEGGVGGGIVRCSEFIHSPFILSSNH